MMSRREPALVHERIGEANKNEHMKAISIILDEPSNTYYICGDEGMLARVNNFLSVVPAENCTSRGCFDQHAMLESATKRKSKQKEWKPKSAEIEEHRKQNAIKTPRHDHTERVKKY